MGSPLVARAGGGIQRRAGDSRVPAQSHQTSCCEKGGGLGKQDQGGRREAEAAPGSPPGLCKARRETPPVASLWSLGCHPSSSLSVPCQVEGSPRSRAPPSPGLAGLRRLMKLWGKERKVKRREIGQGRAGQGRNRARRTASFKAQTSHTLGTAALRPAIAADSKASVTFMFYL